MMEMPPEFPYCEELFWPQRVVYFFHMELSIALSRSEVGNDSVHKMLPVCI